MNDVNIAALHRSIQWRERHPALSQRKSLRWVAGLSDQLPGWLIDGYDRGVVATAYGELKDPEATFRELQRAFPNQSLHLKYRANGFRWLGSKEPWTCEDLGLIYEIRTDLKHDFGLFLDTHAARDWVSQNSRGLRVLNLFAYTCAFGLVAANNGAKTVTNIDASDEYLHWGKCNAQLNGLDFRNLKDTVQKYLPRHLRRLETGKDEPYDLIIADPPAFLVGRGDDRLGRKLWPALLTQLQRSRCPRLLLINNDRAFLSTRSWPEYLKEHLGERWKIHPLQQSQDCLGPNPHHIDPHYAPPLMVVAEAN